jgi:SAM-dependent methyltransferase
MEPGALRPYERSLITGEALALHRDDGRPLTVLDVDRWRGSADATDLEVLACALAPALDIGCGPGRIVEALARLGRFAIGIDISATAVELTRARGVTALRRSVFAPLPGEGRWNSALLLDGNIGIGGAPDVLLQRVGRLLADGGVVLVETCPDPDADERLSARFTRTGVPIGAPFAWANLGSNALHRLARGAGLTVERTWEANGRTFTVLQATAGGDIT